MTTMKELIPDKEMLKRYRFNRVWTKVFFASTLLSVLVLIVLIFNIINNAFGFVAIENEIDPSTLAVEGMSLEDMDHEQLITVMKTNMSKGLVRRYEFEKPLKDRSIKELKGIVYDRVVNPRIIESWSLEESLFMKGRIRAFKEKNPESKITFRAWIHPKFLVMPQASIPEKAGIRTAILGSIWMIFVTVLFAFPIGIGAAVYLEEYAADNRVNRIIQTNIYNLAGIPSIIYGLLGLAIFVRVMEPLTSGSVFGHVDPNTANGRTILSGGMTLALLILPIIIINAQEALRALPMSMRYSSYGLGATKWQTIWHHLLPNSMDRILTGTILSVSRALGETAPLVVIGASTFITVDPDSVFSKFTTLPIQIYQWSARPQGEFRNIAAAAILILLVLLLSMNTFAILARNSVSRKKQVG